MNLDVSIDGFVVWALPVTLFVLWYHRCGNLDAAETEMHAI